MGRSFGPKIPISLNGISGGAGVGGGVGGPGGPKVGGIVGTGVGTRGGVGVGSRKSKRSRPVSTAPPRRRGFRSSAVKAGISSGTTGRARGFRLRAKGGGSTARRAADGAGIEASTGADLSRALHFTTA